MPQLAAVAAAAQRESSALIQVPPDPPLRSDHWRKNTPVLGARHRAFAIDLLVRHTKGARRGRGTAGGHSAAGSAMGWPGSSNAGGGGDRPCHQARELPQHPHAHPHTCPAPQGYGFSDKPDPRAGPPNATYNFDTWGRQLADFTEQVVGGPAFMITNSVGGARGRGAPAGGVSSREARGI